MVIKACFGVSFFGLHLAIKSGRGRPTEFFMTSVINEERMRLMNRPKIVTWALCNPGWKTAAHRHRRSNGTMPAYTMFQAGQEGISQTEVNLTVNRGLEASYPLRHARRLHEGIEWRGYLKRTCGETVQ